jgi:phosphate transport system substrate-binding protein
MDPKQLGLDGVDEFEASLIDDSLGRAETPTDGDSATDATPVPPTSAAQAPLDAEAAPAAADEGRWAGKRLSHFRLMRLIGSGTMGVVFQAEDVNLRRIAALKVLRRQVKGADRAQLVERFLLEARTAAGIDHPSIAHVYEIDEHAGWWYIAMEYLEGGSLKQIVQTGGPIPPERAIFMFVDAARGLEAAHEAGVIHRDMKPSNLLLTRRGRCKLVDFGLVKLESADNPFANDDDRLVLGTPNYVAPEVALGRGAVFASDVYGFGATAYTVLAGQPPFQAESVRELLRQHVKAAIPDVRDKVPECSPHLADLLKQTMAKDPADRPTAGELAAALQVDAAGVLNADSSLSLSPDGSGYDASPGLASGSRTGGVPAVLDASTVPIRRARFRWWIWGLVALLFIVAGGVSWWNLTQPTMFVPPAPEPISRAGTTLVNSLRMRLSYLPPGRFTMGSPPTEPGRNNDERRVDVKLSRGVYMGATEVTQEQWAAVMGADYVPPEGLHPSETGGRRFIGDTLPAYVSWFEAAEFCRRLSEQDRKYYRLPTEAEWEYACRAGTTTAFNTGDELPLSKANIDAEAAPDGTAPVRHPMPVASFSPNAWGLYDMHGNVMEWCLDWKAEYRLGPLTDPIGPTTGTARVLRGGSWDHPARVARCANRWSNPPQVRTDYIGFRVVLEPHARPPENQQPYLDPRTDGGSAARIDLDDFVPQIVVSVDPALPPYTPQVVLDQRLRSVGSDTMDRLMRMWEQAFQEYHPDVVIRHEGRGSGTATPALVEGLSHIGPMSRALKPAEQREFQSEYGYGLTQLRVAIDALAVYVHPNNPIARRGLSLDELDAIYSSDRVRGYPEDIARWGAVGLSGMWMPAPIHVYGRNSSSGTYGVFQEIVLRGGAYKSTNHELVGSMEIIDAVASDPLGVGYGGIGYNVPDVRAIPIVTQPDAAPVTPTPTTAYDGSYPLARPLYLTVDAPPSRAPLPLQQEFLRFVYSRAGQTLVAEAGFYPVTAEIAARELRAVGLALNP